MQFTLYTAVATLGGLAVQVSAKASFTNTAFDVKAGQPFNLTWSETDGTGPFTLALQTGPSSALQDVAKIASGIEAFYYVYTPPSTLASDVYNFEITDSSGEPNYSVKFTFVGSASSSSSASSVSSLVSIAPVMTSITIVRTASVATETVTKPASNSTINSSTNRTTGTIPSNSASATRSIVNTNGAEHMSSPLAFLLLNFAVFAFFN